MNEENKLKSRKFIVWLVWLAITAGTFIFCIARNPENSSTLLEKVLGYFSGVSMLYLGCNAGQKAACVIADAMAPKEEATE